MDKEALYQQVVQIYYSLIRSYVPEAVYEHISTGGAEYELIHTDAVQGVDEWYAMYEPKYYKRLNTFYNISITHGDCVVSGSSFDMRVDVRIISPHKQYAKGFTMRNGVERPGGDLLKYVPEDIEVKDLQLSESVRQECMYQALQMVMQMIGNGG